MNENVEKTKKSFKVFISGVGFTKQQNNKIRPIGKQNPVVYP